MCVNKKGEKELESKCSQFGSNKQTNVASRAKTSMKQQQSFGMKMNNEHAIQKDKVSFGAPEWWKGLKIAIGSAVGGITTGVTELGKNIFDEPSTPRELKARFVGDSLMTTQAAASAAVSVAGSITASFVEPAILIQNENDIVDAITDVYSIYSTHEKNKIKEEVGVTVLAGKGALVGGGAVTALKEIGDKAAEEGASYILKETASNIPLIGSIVRTGVSGVTAKVLVEKTIKACKKAKPRH